MLKKISPAAFICLLFLKLAMPLVGLTLNASAQTSSAIAHTIQPVDAHKAAPVMICHRMQAQLNGAHGSEPQPSAQYPSQTCFLCDLLNGHWLVAGAHHDVSPLSWREIDQLFLTQSLLETHFAFEASARAPPIMRL